MASTLGAPDCGTAGRRAQHRRCQPGDGQAGGPAGRRSGWTIRVAPATMTMTALVNAAAAAAFRVQAGRGPWSRGTARTMAVAEEEDVLLTHIARCVPRDGSCLETADVLPGCSPGWLLIC